MTARTELQPNAMPDDEAFLPNVETVFTTSSSKERNKSETVGEFTFLQVRIKEHGEVVEARLRPHKSSDQGFLIGGHTLGEAARPLESKPCYHESKVEFLRTDEERKRWVELSNVVMFPVRVHENGRTFLKISVRTYEDSAAGHTAPSEN